MAKTSDKFIKMGLGTAIRRLLDVEKRFNSGMRSEEITAERNLLLTALDDIKLDIGWDCDEDGVPDTVEIFQKSASTSCCRILPGGSDKPPRSKSTPRVRKARKK